MVLPPSGAPEGREGREGPPLQGFPIPLNVTLFPQSGYIVDTQAVKAHDWKSANRGY